MLEITLLLIIIAISLIYFNPINYIYAVKLLLHVVSLILRQWGYSVITNDFQPLQELLTVVFFYITIFIIIISFFVCLISAIYDHVPTSFLIATLDDKKKRITTIYYHKRDGYTIFTKNAYLDDKEDERSDLFIAVVSLIIIIPILCLLFYL